MAAGRNQLFRQGVGKAMWGSILTKLWTEAETTEVARRALESDQRIAQMLIRLRRNGYVFVTPTPATHRRVLRRRAECRAADVRDVLGWSLPFSRTLLPEADFAALRDAGLLKTSDAGFTAQVRVSSLGDDLFLHSAFPPTAEDAVFFGPDTYRFANFLHQELADGPPIDLVVDVGAGSGAGAVVAAKATGSSRVIVTDINPAALHLARINLAAAGVTADFKLANGLEGVPERADLIIANPPFIAGDGGRTYRDGGDMHGCRLSLDWSLQATAKLALGGRFLLYTGSAIVAGQDPFLEALRLGIDPRDYDPHRAG